MASIVNNKQFRALLLRKTGATGAELQECTGRAYVYSTWSLRCMETATHKLYTLKDGNATRYYLMTPAAVAAEVAKAKAAQQAAEAKAKAKVTATKAAKAPAVAAAAPASDAPTL